MGTTIPMTLLNNTAASRDSSSLPLSHSIFYLKKNYRIKTDKILI